MTIRLKLVTVLTIFTFAGCNLSSLQLSPKNPVNEAPQTTSVNISPPAGTQQTTSSQISPGVQKLTQTKAVRTQAIIEGDNVAWQQAPSFQDQSEFDVYTYNLGTKNLRRLGITKELFGNKLNVEEQDFTTKDGLQRGNPRLSNGYVVWIELNPNSDIAPLGNLYFSPLDGKLQKNLIVENVEPDGFFVPDGKVFYQPFDVNKDFYIDPESGNKLIPPGGEAKGYIIYDLKAGKKVGVLPPPGEDTLLDVSNNIEHFLRSDGNGKYNLMSKDLGDQKEKKYEVNINFDSVNYHFYDEVLYWAESDPATNQTVIKSYDLSKESTSTLKSGIPGGTFVDFGVSDEMVVWYVFESKNESDNGLFALNRKTGEVKSLLQGTQIKPIPYVQRELEGRVSGNKVVFIGYEGELQQDTSFTDVYVATL